MNDEQRTEGDQPEPPTPPAPEPNQEYENFEPPVRESKPVGNSIRQPE